MTTQSSTIPGLLSSHMQTTDQFYDVTLECEEHSFSCHKIILAAQSKFFTSLFSDKFSGGGASVFQLRGVTKTGLEQAINCLYGYPMILTMNTIWKVVKDADYLLLDEVMDKCDTFLLSTLRPVNCLGVWALAEQFHLARLSSQVVEFIMFNFMEMGGTEEFLAMDWSTLVSILADDRLVVREEEDVWRLAQSWIQGNMDKKEQVDKVVGAIRFALMDKDYLKQNVAPQLSSSSSIFLEEVNEYLVVLDYPTTTMAKLMLNKYNSSTPQFALPRLPAQFLLLLGGFTTSPTTSMAVYDQLADRWTQLDLQLPDGLPFPSAESVEGSVVLVGGVSQFYGQSPIPSPSRNTLIIDLNRQVVERVPDMKVRRTFVTTAVVGETVYAVGERSSEEESGRLSDCEMLKLSSSKQPLNWERIQPVRPGRSGAGAVGVKDEVWVVGGFDGQNHLSSVQVLHTGTGRWRRGPDLLIGRSGLSCAYLGGFIYAAGGDDGSSRLRSVERIKPGASRWERVAHMTNPRTHFSLSALGGRLVAAGGFTVSNVSAEVEMFDPEAGVWIKVESMPEAKWGMASVVVDRRMLSREVLELFTLKREGLTRENIARRMAEMNEGHWEEGRVESDDDNDE